MNTMASPVITGILKILANLTLEDRIVRGGRKVSKPFTWSFIRLLTPQKEIPTDVLADYEVEYKLFHFGRQISFDDVIREMEKEGFRPGTFVELLTLVEARPELIQEKAFPDEEEFPIVAPGTLWSEHAPVASSMYGEYSLRPQRDDGCRDHYRFLGVRKMSKENSDESSA